MRLTIRSLRVIVGICNKQFDLPPQNRVAGGVSGTHLAYERPAHLFGRQGQRGCGRLLRKFSHSSRTGRYLGERVSEGTGLE